MDVAPQPPTRSPFELSKQLRELFEAASPEELAEAIGVLAQMRSVAAGLADFKQVATELRRLELIAELHRLNLLSIEQLGHPLKSHEDFAAVADDDAPSIGTYRRFFGSLEAARYEARLLETAYPEAISSLPIGRVPRQIQMSARQCEQAFAQLVEELGGVLPTAMQVHIMRVGKNPRTSPGVNRLLSVDGKRVSLPAVHARAVELILADPERYPRANRIWRSIPHAARRALIAQADQVGD